MDSDDRRRLGIWGMGWALTAHLAAFMSVAYFDQMVISWFWLLDASSVAGLDGHDLWIGSWRELGTWQTFEEPQRFDPVIWAHAACIDSDLDAGAWGLTVFPWHP